MTKRLVAVLALAGAVAWLSVRAWKKLANQVDTAREPTRLETVVRSYVDWLEVKAPAHRTAFLARLRAEPEAARAEAVIFGVLRGARLNPKPAEVVGAGGVDFLCEPAAAPAFVVEVTTLLIKTVSEGSGLSHPLGAGFRGFSQVTRAFLREAVNKASQLADHPMPRLLVLATEHDGGALLMNSHSAEELLTGTTLFQVRIGDAEATPQVITHLTNSVFCRPSGDGSIEAARQSISGILLVSISKDAASVIGLLHPAPAVAFDPSTLSQVHFVRFRSWPIRRDERFGIEWTGPAPSPTVYHHLPFGFEDGELRRTE